MQQHPIVSREEWLAALTDWVQHHDRYEATAKAEP